MTNPGLSALFAAASFTMLAEAPSSRAETGIRGGNPQECDAGESPDIIVGDIFETSRHGRIGDITAYSFGRAACNTGTCWLNWFDHNNQHPVVGCNMHRLKTVDGGARFEQLGMGWLKHEYFALSGALCFSDCQSTNGEHLGVHCHDTSSAGLMGQQSNLGPRSQVNPSTGDFPYPWTAPPPAPTIGRRLQVHDADLDPPLNAGALYFAEIQFIAADDATTGHGNNNASYRRIVVSESVENTFNIQFAGASPPNNTQRERSAIRAWKEHGLGVGTPDPNVEERDIQVPDDGLFILAAKATDLGTGFWRYEYAIQNLNSHRSARSFSVPLPFDGVVQNAGFHDVDYHSGEPYDLTDWTIAISPNSIAWSTDSFEVNENANALRWGTLYNFRFDANVAPVQNTVTLGLFRPGTPAEATALVVAPPLGPPDCNENGIDDSTDIAAGTSEDCDHNGTPDECELAGNDCNADGTPDHCQVAGSGSADCDTNGVPDECQADCDNDGTPDTCEPGLVLFEDDFETDKGWTVDNVAPVVGMWERADPQQTLANSVVVQPEFDNPAGAGSLCYVTDSRGPMTNQYDVDHGPTRLISPMLDLTAGSATVSYAYWFHSQQGQSDTMEVEASSDGGSTWTSNRSYNVSGSVWRYEGFVVGSGTATMRFRFSISDPGNDSYTEGLIDDFVVTAPDCPQVPAATVTSAVSRKPNPSGPAGVCDIDLLPPRQSEPRNGRITELRIAFDVPPGTPSSLGVAMDHATCPAPTFTAYAWASALTSSVAANELVLTFTPPLENGRTYRFKLGPSVTTIAGQAVEVRGLVGDVNSDGLVNATDRSHVMAVWTGDGFSCQSDLDGDGATNALDRSVAVGAWTGTQNCAP